MPTITRTQARRTLLAPTQVPIHAPKTISSLTRSGTTATATSTAHGYSNGDWVMIAGADRPQYNGPFKISNVATNTFDFVLESDPGASASGSISAQKGVASAIWGDGTTVDGNATVGAIATALGGDLTIRIAITTEPTTRCRASVFRSDTGASGTWRELISVEHATGYDAITGTGVYESTHRVEVPRGKFVLVYFWRVAGTPVVVDCVGVEDTSAASS